VKISRLRHIEKEVNSIDFEENMVEPDLAQARRLLMYAPAHTIQNTHILMPSTACLQK
jgi:hypothetical protein